MVLFCLQVLELFDNYEVFSKKSSEPIICSILNVYFCKPKEVYVCISCVYLFHCWFLLNSNRFWFILMLKSRNCIL